MPSKERWRRRRKTRSSGEEVIVITEEAINTTAATMEAMPAAWFALAFTFNGEFCGPSRAVSEESSAIWTAPDSKAPTWPSPAGREPERCTPCPATPCPATQEVSLVTYKLATKPGRILGFDYGFFGYDDGDFAYSPREDLGLPRCSYVNTDFDGDDVGDGRGLTAASLYDCKRACVDQNGCRFWTFRRGWERNCYLKRRNGDGGELPEPIILNDLINDT